MIRLMLCAYLLRSVAATGESAGSLAGKAGQIQEFWRKSLILHRSQLPINVM